MGKLKIHEGLSKILKNFTRQVRKVSIYKRLIISFLIISIIPNLIIVYYTFKISSDEMVKRVSNSSSQAIKSVEFNINDKLKIYETLSNQINQNQSIIDLIKECNASKQRNDDASKIQYGNEKKEIGRILYKLSFTNDLSNIEIVSNDDEFTQFSDGVKPIPILKDISSYRQRQNYQKALIGQYWSDWTDTSHENGVFQVNQVNGEGTTYLGNYLTLSNPILDDENHKPLGVIIITIPTKIFSDMVDFQNMYDENEVVFLTGKLGILYVLNGRYSVDMPDKSILNKIVAKQQGNFVETIENKENIFSFGKVDKADMVVTYMVEKSKALNSVYKVRNIIFEVTIVCVLCGMLLAYFVTSSISKPLNKLKKTMERVEAKGLEFEYRDSSKDEIGTLGIKFNNMLQGIRNLMDTVMDKELSRKNEEIKRKQAELDALQMQIKDHFIYNTLDLIRWNAMFIENGEGLLSKMISDFSVFLRFSTKKTNKLVEISEEIAHIYAYLKVLQFNKEMELDIVNYIKDESILHCKITKLTFQPIVENALKYGFGNIKIHPRITISAYNSKGDLFIEIKDNGKGMSKEMRNKLNQQLELEDYKGGSIGLPNINERIKLNFGNQYGLRIETEEGKYTCVIIHIPNIKQDTI
ncbi:MAG TPA: histidine kinase [Ruminiclostridium sp.]